MRFLIDEETTKVIDRAIECSGGQIDDTVIADFVARQARYIRDVEIQRPEEGGIRLEFISTQNVPQTHTRLSILMISLRDKLLPYIPDPALL
jgi:hypothetical protein